MDSENSDYAPSDSLSESQDSISENSDSSDVEVVSKRARMESTNDAENESSVSITMGMEKWQQTTNTVVERDNYLLDKKMFTDIKFIVGKEEEEILCHRLHLARTSPVFADLFYGELANENNDSEIKIPDVSPSAFKALLKYVYSGKLKLKNDDLVLQILYAAKKYSMPNELLYQIRGYIQTQFSSSTYGFKNAVNQLVWSAIHLAENCVEEELQGSIWQYVEENTGEMIKLDSFVNISLTILETLVKKDNLRCTEDELFQACIKWAKHEAMNKNIDPEPQIIRETLKTILPYIRFLTFNAEDFSNGSVKSEVLTTSEIESVKCYQISKQIPTNICNIITPRKYQKPDHFYVIGESVSTFNRLDNVGNPLPAFKYSEFTSPDEAFDPPSKYVVGFKIPSQINTSSGSENNDSYIEEFTAYFYEQELMDDDLEHRWNRHEQPCYDCFDKEFQDERIAEIRHFRSVVKYNSEIIVLFDKSSSFNDGYFFDFGIVFLKSGCYPKKYVHNTPQSEIKLGVYSNVEIKELDCGFMKLLYYKK